MTLETQAEYEYYPAQVSSPSQFLRQSIKAVPCPPGHATRDMAPTPNTLHAILVT